MQKNSYDLAIIGAGAAGLSAAIYAIRANLKIVLIEKGFPGGQINSTNEVENYLGFGKISGAELATNFMNHAKLYDFKIISAEVSNLENRNNSFDILLSNNQKIQSQAVILATGGKPRKLKIPGEKKMYGNGVSYCATCDGFFFKNKTVIVVGGGDTAAEEATYLNKICKKVYLAHRRNVLRASKVLQKKLKNSDKITILWETIPTSIIADENSISGIKLLDLKSNKTIDLKVDGVFIFIGYEPNNDLIPKNINTDSKGMIVTNDSCETNIPGLYAVGDLRSKPARQIILSAADGCNAALSAAKYIESNKK